MCFSFVFWERIREILTFRLNLISNLQIGIRENLVLPNFECVTIPFMQAEKDDWVPFNAAPFIWPNHTSEVEAPNLMGDSPRTSTDHQQKPKSAALNQEPANKSMNIQGAPSSSFRKAGSVEELTTLLEDEETVDLKEPVFSSIEKLKPQETKDLSELRLPLLQNVMSQDILLQKMEEGSSSSITPGMSDVLLERQDTFDETLLKKMGKKEKMNVLRRKMSEKFEKKKRHIEEKSKSLVDKMLVPREP